MAKSKLRYEKVYTRRNVRDPIDWVRIEEIRNEGWELLTFIGTPAESAKNPTVAPLYAVFCEDKTVAKPAPLPKPKPEPKPKTARKGGRFASVAEKAMNK